VAVVQAFKKLPFLTPLADRDGAAVPGRPGRHPRPVRVLGVLAVRRYQPAPIILAAAA
jgi:hypothetical protein